jgi:hypothetical protein
MYPILFETVFNKLFIAYPNRIVKTQQSMIMIRIASKRRVHDIL